MALYQGPQSSEGDSQGLIERYWTRYKKALRTPSFSFSPASFLNQELLPTKQKTKTHKLKSQQHNDPPQNSKHRSENAFLEGTISLFILEGAISLFILERAISLFVLSPHAALE